MEDAGRCTPILAMLMIKKSAVKKSENKREPRPRSLGQLLPRSPRRGLLLDQLRKGRPGPLKVTRSKEDRKAYSKLGVIPTFHLEVNIYTTKLAGHSRSSTDWDNVLEVHRHDLEKLRGPKRPKRENMDTESWQPFKLILTDASLISRNRN